jgi:hypothetical protein
MGLASRLQQGAALASGAFAAVFLADFLHAGGAAASAAVLFRPEIGVWGRFEGKYTVFFNLVLDAKTCYSRGGGQPRKTGWGQGGGRFKGMFGRDAGGNRDGNKASSKAEDIRKIG